MSKRFPSLIALLGLVAVAGYQNREKIADFVKSLNGPDPAAGAIAGMKKALGDGPLATTITGGLGQLVDQFKAGGEGDKAESWVAPGPNAPITGAQMEHALGAELIDDLVAQTGLDRTELLSRLATVLPEAVDKLTPEGRLPA